MNNCACACMGPMYGEPYCYCEMIHRGLDVESNPIRVKANEDSARQWKKLWEPGGWFYELNMDK